MNSHGDVVSFSSSFIKPSGFAPLPTTGKLSSQDALLQAESSLGGKRFNKDPEFAYLAMENGNIALTHAVRLALDNEGHIVEAYVDADSGELRGLVDYTSDLSVCHHSLQRSLNLMMMPDARRAHYKSRPNGCV